MKHLKTIFACLLMAVLSIGQVWAEDVTISYTDIPDGFTATTGTSGSFFKTVSSANDLTINYSGINTKSSAGAADHAYGYAMFLKNYGYVYSGAAPDGYYPSNVVVTFGSNTGTSGKAGITYGSSSLNTRNSSVTGAVAKSGTCSLTNSDPTKTYWNFSTTGANVQVANIVVTYTSTGGTSTCATPTFSPAAGGVLSGTEVTISCTTEGAAIYYSTDGNAPTIDAEHLYDAEHKPVVSAATTIKAIATKSAYNNSAVATAAYTVLTPKTTMDEIFAAAETAGSTATTVAITFNDWVVSGVSTNGKTVFLTDGTKGLMIYDNGAAMGFVAGHILSGTVVCKVELKNGSSQLTALNSSTTGLSVSTGGTATLNVLDAEGITALTGVNTGSLIKVSGACTSANSKYYIAGVQLYNTLFAFTNPTAGTNYECTGVFQLYGSTKEMLPRSAADIVAQTSVATPTISPDPSVTYTEAQNISIACTTDGTTIYYTTDGTDPKTSGTKQTYSAPFSLNASATIKAIANKGDDWSEVATAAYTINIPLPAHDFQIVHKFETGEGFEFPDGWTNSYAEHEIAFTDDKVVFAAASKQSAGSTIEDCPVTKNQAISLVLTNSAKLISAVRFDYKQWGTKAQTLTMKYSTDGGASYSAFDPIVSSSDFALQVLTLPAGTNAIQVTGSNSSNQVGLTKISFDLEDKPIVTKTVTITPPSNGTLVVKNAGVAITSGDAIAVGTTLTIVATPNTDYSLDAISVKDEGDNDVPVNGENEFEVPNSNVTVSATFVEDVRPDASLTLWENGNEVAFGGSHKQNDHVTLPTSVTHNCANRVFVGWSTEEVAQTNDKPAYLEPGADFVLSAAGENTLYAVYAAVATPASYQKLESDAFETTATYVIGAEKNSNVEYFYNYASVDANCWGLMSADVATNSPIVFTLSGTAAELVAQDAAGKYLKPVSGNFQMSASSQNFVLADDGTITTATLNLRYNTSYGLRWYTNTTGNSAYFYKVIAPTYNKYSTTCDAAIDAPEFTPTEGTYTSAQNITISAATGATIYYTMTTDNSEPADPTDESAVYSSAISLSEAGTYKFKAFAVKGEAESEITEATYTINLPLTTMDQIFAKANAVGTTATDVTIVFNNWVISGVSTDGKQVYLTDGSKGLVIFDNGGSLGFSVGNILSGTVDCKVQKYNGFSEVTTLTSSSTGLTVSEGGTITPQSVSIEDLSGVNTGAPIIVNNVKYDGTNFTDGTNNIQPYTTLFADAVTSLTTNKYYNVTGIYTQFNSKKEILPRNADDIEELAQTAPTMTWYTSSAKTATIAASATYSISVGDEFAPIFETNSSGTLTYSSNNDAVATINATTGALTLVGGTGDVLITCAVAADDVHNYAAGSQSFTLRVLQGATVDNVVILAQYNGTWYAMKNTGVTSSKAAAIEVAYSGGKVWNLSSSDQEAITWKRTVDGEGNVTFQAPNNNYLQMSGNNLAMGAVECQWTWNDTYYRVGSQARTFLYRPSADGFKSNAVSNAGTNDYSALPVITTAVFADGEGYTEVRAGLEINRYYTVCLPKKVTAIKGASFWTLHNKSQDGTTAYLEEETNNLPFAAGKPFIIQATAENLEVVYEGAATEDAGTNGALHGTLVYMNAAALAAAGGSDVYMLYENALRPVGGNNHLDANRAYVLLSDLDAVAEAPQSAPGRRVRAMPMQPQTATGIEDLNASEKPMKMMINGQIFILRGEKMYDTTGRLVK